LNDSMIKQVAMAIAFDRRDRLADDPNDYWATLSEVDQMSFEGNARAAIEAMHDPTDAMIGAAYAVGPTISSAEREPAAVWRAMNNAALLEEHLP